ncbi:S-layer homology domain-containing protein [Radiobacillus deserti]|uniref:S-layer homology domain-containing protein n=1 Tax=Radiobacillus deserti TaxID=2594883 RepID=A0A516KJG9_9BACI|nr:S-layer homology domain-containing protein [Radiobacillus deserti]QDP41521.1 S-layer homology domain-containing protein [Radiobacillus deserti]
MNKITRNKQIQKILATTAAIPVAVAPLATSVQISADSLSYKDLNKDDQGFEHVKNLESLNVMKGYEDGTFKPYENITREHVAVILANALNLPTPTNLSAISTYKDITEEHTYAKEIAAVTEAGIFKGSDGFFNPKNPITREQAATVLVKAFRLYDNYEKVSLNDLDKISPSHQENVKILAQHQITVGKQQDDGTRYFDGDGNLKRIQFAIFVDKLLSKSPSMGNISSIKNDEIVVSGHTYSVDESVKNILSYENRAILNDAFVDLEITNEVVTGINYIELNSKGTASTPLVLEGHNATLNGSIKVNGDHTTVKNLQVQHNLILDDQTKGLINFENVQVLGDTLFKSPNGTRSIQSESSFEATFSNSSLHNVIMQRLDGKVILLNNTNVANISVEANSILKGDSSSLVRNVQVGKNVDQFELGLNVDELTIDGSQTLNIDGISKIGKLFIKEKNTTFRLSNDIFIESLVLPKGVDLKDIISNYDSIKDHINNVDEVGEENNPVVVSPSTGGSGSDNPSTPGPVLSDGGATATVYSEDDFVTALYQESVNTVILGKTFTFSKNYTITKAVKIPETANQEEYDFNQSSFKSLEISGDNITVKNSTLTQLVVRETVENLTLDNVKDSIESNHLIQGGGAHSIELIGNTIFKGDIQIRSGEDVQIRAESADAKIEGTVWIDSEDTTIISAPVSQVVVSNANVQIKSEIDELMITDNVTITLQEGGSITSIKKRINLDVTVKDADGNILEAEEALDTMRLNRGILKAQYLLDQAVVGTSEGNYSQDSIDHLKNVLDESKNVLNTTTELSTDSQNLIDGTANTIYEQIDNFLTGQVTVNRSALHEEINRAKRLMNEIDPANYSEEIISQLETTLEAAIDLESTYGLSQNEIDAKKAELADAIDSVQNSNPEVPIIEGAITFDIKSDLFVDSEVYVQVYPRDYFDSGVTSSANLTNEGIKVDISNIDETLGETFYAVISTNGYVIVEPFSKEEAISGAVKEIVLDPNDYMNPNLVIGDYTGDFSEENFSLQVAPLSESGDPIVDGIILYASENELIPKGNYDLQFVGTNETDYFALFKENALLSDTTNGFSIANEEMVDLELAMESSNPVNYTINHFVAHPDMDSFNSGSADKLEGKNTVHITSGIYDYLSFNVTLQDNQDYWVLDYMDLNKEINQSSTITLDDHLKLNHDGPELPEGPVQINPTYPLSSYFSFGLINGANQHVTFSKAHMDGELLLKDKQIPLNIEVTANGNTYSATAERMFDLNMTVQDIMEGQEITGEAQITFSLMDAPIPVEAYTRTIEISQ